jgi:hypothetical protein
LVWESRITVDAIELDLAFSSARGRVAKTPFGLSFDWDPSVTPVSPLANPRPDGATPLPLLLHAADFGTLLVEAEDGSSIAYESHPRPRPMVEVLSLMHPLLRRRETDGLYELTPGEHRLRLRFSIQKIAPFPRLADSDDRLAALPRSWLNSFQYKPDSGSLANNPLTDNAFLSLFNYADPAVFTPVLPDGIDCLSMVRQSVDTYFSGGPGYGVGNEDRQTDTIPSILISAWDVFRVTGDRALLDRWLPHLEAIADRLVRQDRNGNGLPESTNSGVSRPFRGTAGNWWDQINFGFEDAYVSALAFRAFNCISDLESVARRESKKERYEKQAELIRENYVPTFLNPATGILAGWKDSNGKLHDYWFTFVNGIAIAYGLVPDALGNSILDRFQARFHETKFDRYDLGLPGNLAPIAKLDHGTAALGSPNKEDGTDTFGTFENGGATACYAQYYIQALYRLGRRSDAEKILWPMVKTYSEGGFQNGVGHGGEWRDWRGKPSGFEGFLADAYAAQSAVFAGHYGIAFTEKGFGLQPWSPLKGKGIPANLRFMGKPVNYIE